MTYRLIQRNKIQQGIDLCKENIFAFLETAQSLLDTNNLNHATISAEFAIEEFGKILMIRDACKSGSDPVQVPNQVFTSHEDKSDRAWRKNDLYALDPRYKMISKGGFERSDNGKQGFSRSFTQAINITHDIRKECAFVDYCEDEGLWYLGHPEIDEVKLQNLIDHVKEKTSISSQ